MDPGGQTSLLKSISKVYLKLVLFELLTLSTAKRSSHLFGRDTMLCESIYRITNRLPGKH